MSGRSRCLLAVSRPRAAALFPTVAFPSGKLPTMQQRTTETYFARRKRIHEIFQAVNPGDANSCLGAGRAASKELRTLQSGEGFAILDETIFHVLRNLVQTRQVFRAAQLMTRIVREHRLPLEPSFLETELVDFLKHILHRLPQVACCDPGITRNSPFVNEDVTGEHDEDEQEERRSVFDDGMQEGATSFPMLDGTARSMVFRLLVPCCNLLESVFPRLREQRKAQRTPSAEDGEEGAPDDRPHQEKLLMFIEMDVQRESIRELVEVDYSTASLPPVNIFTTLLGTAIAVTAETGDVVVLQGLVVMFLNSFVACDGSGELLSEAWTSKSHPSKSLSSVADALRAFSDEFIANYYYGLYMSTRRSVDSGRCFVSPRARYEAHCGSLTHRFIEEQLQIVIAKNKLGSAMQYGQFCTATVSAATDTLISNSSFSPEELELISLRAQFDGDCEEHMERAVLILRRVVSFQRSAPRGVEGSCDDAVSNVLNHCLELCGYHRDDRSECASSEASAALLAKCTSRLKNVIQELSVEQRLSLTAEQCTTFCIALRPALLSSSAGGQHIVDETLLWLFREALVPSLCRAAPASIGNVFGSAIELLLICNCLTEAKQVFAALSEHKNVFSSTIPPNAFKKLFDAARDAGDVELCLLLRESRQQLF